MSCQRTKLRSGGVFGRESRLVECGVRKGQGSWGLSLIAAVVDAGWPVDRDGWEGWLEMQQKEMDRDDGDENEDDAG